MSGQAWHRDGLIVVCAALAGYLLLSLIGGAAWTETQQVERAAVGAALGAMCALLVVITRRYQLAQRELERSRMVRTQLQRSEERFLHLYDHAREMFATVDVSSGVVLSCNKTLCKTLDYKREDVLGKPVLELYHPSSQGTARSMFRSNEYAIDVHKQAVRLRRQDGSAVECVLNANTVQDSEGKKRHTQCRWRDVSQENSVVRTLEDLASSADTDDAFLRRCVRHLGQIYETQAVFLGVYDDSEKTAIRTLARWSSERGFVDNYVYDLAGTPCQDVLNGAVELISRGLATLYSRDVILARAKLESYCGVPLVTSNNEVVGLLSVVDSNPIPEDHFARSVHHVMANRIAHVLERQSWSDDLHRSEARFRDFANIAADYLWEMDCNLRFTLVSDRYRDITGLDPKSLLGHTQDELLAAETSESDLWARHAEDIRHQRPFDSEFSWVTPIGNTIVLNHRGSPTFGHDGSFQGYRGTGRDITNAYRLSEQLAYQASHDGLTDLTNRTEFDRRLRSALDLARVSGAEHALCYLDLDQFKVVNDTCGHMAGDELLRQISQLLRTQVRTRDTLARLGGDEFGVLMERCNLENAHRLADGLRRSVEAFRFNWEDKVFTVGISIGLVPIDRDSPDSAAIMRAADTACYAAKDEGRNRIHVYHEKDTEVARRQGEMQWISTIGSALEEGRFRLFAQSIQPLAADDYGLAHYEILLRMVGTDGEIILPGEFLPAAERYNIATKLDRWVIEAARDWFSQNPEQLEQLHTCAINLSGQSLGDPGFLRFVMDQFRDGSLPPERICFEITETAAIGNLTQATAFINSLTTLGCRFGLDDFGSGLSSFAYLRSLSVDFLKIDGIFVKDIVTDVIDMAMVKSINDIGHVLGKKTVAEFVENAEILALLRDIGVDYAQGYHIAAPVPIEALRRSPVAVA